MEKLLVYFPLVILYPLIGYNGEIVSIMSLLGMYCTPNSEQWDRPTFKGVTNIITSVFGC